MIAFGDTSCTKFETPMKWFYQILFFVLPITMNCRYKHIACCSFSHSISCTDMKCHSGKLFNIELHSRNISCTNFNFVLDYSSITLRLQRLSCDETDWKQFLNMKMVEYVEYIVSNFTILRSMFFVVIRKYLTYFN